MKEITRVLVYLSFVVLFLTTKLGFVGGIFILLIIFFNPQKYGVSKIVNYITLRIITIRNKKLTYKSREIKLNKT